MVVRVKMKVTQRFIDNVIGAKDFTVGDIITRDFTVDKDIFNLKRFRKLDHVIDVRILNIKDKVRRKDNYVKLRRVGFNSYEANRFKDFSDEKISNIIDARVISNDSINELTKRVKK